MADRRWLLKALAPLGLLPVAGVLGCGKSLARSETPSGEEKSKSGGSEAKKEETPAAVETSTRPARRRKNISENVPAPFIQKTCAPEIDPSAYVHPLASVIGAVTIGKRVMVSPGASVRGDEGVPIFVGDEANIQDGAVIHALETFEEGEEVAKNLREVGGKKYAVHVGQRVSMAHQSQVHGPATVGDDTFVGMQALVFKSDVGKGCVIEPGALVVGVKIPDGHYVPAGTVCTSAEVAARMPPITDTYVFRTLNKGVVHVNTCLADGYNGKGGYAPAEHA